MDMAASCNCSIKEKEQVYSAARDGSLMYLKVSLTTNKHIKIKIKNKLRKEKNI